MLALVALVAASGGGAVRAQTAAEPGRVTAVDANTAATMDCPKLMGLNLLGLPGAPTSLLSAKVVPATADFPQTWNRGFAPEYCDVTAYVQPQVQFELRLPTHTWNGRYLQTGCGGFCGAIDIEQCADALAGNFAVAAQNMGHVGNGERDPINEPIWGSDPALRIDYGDRSTHVVAIAAKAIIQAYYGGRPAYAYFRGCSTGGREGLSEATKHPEDFDGIIAGDPALPGTAGTISGLWSARLEVTRDGKETFSIAKLRSLHAAVIAACPGLDGLTDGDPDPRDCKFDPASVACPPGQDRDDCLTAAQVDAARQLYDGPRDSHGRRLFPGYMVKGTELGWRSPPFGTLSDAYVKYLAFAQNPPAGYSMWDVDLERDLPATEATAALYDPVAPHAAPDLAAFHARSGKLLVYHGWADGMSSLETLDFHARVVARDGGPEAVDKWFRVFMVAGMAHCRGGGVADKFDALTAMVDWVEKGQAPDRLLASQVANGVVVRTHPIYPYPIIARYRGTGDPADAANWSPAPPPHPHDDAIDWVWAPPK
ncbi:MAG TPA: tannase/feruloyl esterase family alpha/beta hydrolase [Caulobacteraceae bacterium]|nr:tannase/feruloyl esterase family alpha/beta hydrolase [Caulobacteraceae bacterium]